MAASDAQKAADKKYKSKKTKQVVIRFYPGDMDMYHHLCRQGNKMGYIKQLISDDMRRLGIEPGAPPLESGFPVPGPGKPARD